MRKAFITNTFSGNPGLDYGALRTIDVIGAGFDPDFVENVFIEVDYTHGGGSGTLQSTLWSGNVANKDVNKVAGILSVAYITDGIRVTYRLSLNTGQTVSDMELLIHALVGRCT